MKIKLLLAGLIVCAAAVAGCTAPGPTAPDMSLTISAPAGPSAPAL